MRWAKSKSTYSRRLSRLPAEAEAHGNQVCCYVPCKDVMIARLGERFYTTLAEFHGETRAAVDAALILAERADNLVGADSTQVEPKPRIKEDAGDNHRLRILHRAMVNTAATGNIEVHRTFLRQVHHWVKSEAPGPHRAIRRLNLIEESPIDR